MLHCNLSTRINIDRLIISQGANISMVSMGIQAHADILSFSNFITGSPLSPLKLLSRSPEVLFTVTSSLCGALSCFSRARRELPHPHTQCCPPATVRPPPTYWCPPSRAPARLLHNSRISAPLAALPPLSPRHTTPSSNCFTLQPPRATGRLHGS